MAVREHSGEERRYHRKRPYKDKGKSLEMRRERRHSRCFLVTKGLMRWLIGRGKTQAKLQIVDQKRLPVARTQQVPRSPAEAGHANHLR